MPDFYTRMHAASVTDTLGAGLILLGLMLHAGLSLVSVKLLILGLLIFFTSPCRQPCPGSRSHAAWPIRCWPTLKEKEVHHRKADH